MRRRLLAPIAALVLRAYPSTAASPAGLRYLLAARERCHWRGARFEVVPSPAVAPGCSNWPGVDRNTSQPPQTLHLTAVEALPLPRAIRASRCLRAAMVPWPARERCTDTGRREARSRAVLTDIVRLCMAYLCP
jgi:hypothetical protein